ncbi:MAG: anion permease [Armatimonadota bacterium]
MELALLISVIVIALVFDFVNGMDDCANAIATVVSTRALPPQRAVALARTLNVVGAFLTTAVAKTIGKGIVDPETAAVTQGMILAGLLGAIGWTLICWYMGLPTSVSHALIGGLIGIVWLRLGLGVLQFAGIKKILIAMVVSPVAGFLLGLLIMVVSNRLAHRVRAPLRSKNRFFRWTQILSSSYMALSHGTNDTQNAMGIITMALVSYGALSDFRVPFWVILSCGLAMGFGTQVGGWRIIRTMGMKITDLRPVGGFAAETGAATAILGASLLGLPVSTTHTITSSIMGVGSHRSLSMVRWGVARRILWAWVFTVPGSAVIAMLMGVILGVFHI